MAESKYSVVLAAVDQFTRPFRDFRDAGERLQEDVRGQQAELRDLNRQAKDLDGYRRLTDQVDATAASLEEARIEQARLKRELSEAERPTQRMRRAYDRATASVADLTSKHRAQRNELGRLENSLESAGVDVGRFADEQRRIETATERANAALATQRGRMAAVGDARARVDSNIAARAELHGQIVETAALGYIAAQPISQAMSLETAGAEYAKVSNASDEEVAARASANLRLATEREIASGGLTATDLFRIQTAAAQGGIAGDEIDNFTRTSATMANAFDMTADDSGKTLMAWRAGMGLDQQRASLLADMANELGNSYNAESGDIADVLRRQGAVAMGAGLNEGQAAALSAALLNGGATPEVAATALKNTTNALTKGSTATAAQREAMSGLGFSPEQLARDMQDDAPAAMLSVIEALQQEPADEIPALVSTLFGEDSKGAIMPLLANTEALRGAFELVNDQARYQGSMAREAAGLADTTQTTWNRTTSSFGRLATVVGTALLPATNAVLDPLADGANLVADFAEENQTLTAVIGGTAAALVAAKAGFLGVRFAGLLFGQLFNRANLTRAQLNSNTARTATLANAAVGRLNGALARLGAGAGVGGGGRGRRGTGGAPRAGSSPAARAAAAGGLSNQRFTTVPPNSIAAPSSASSGWRARLAGFSERLGNSRAARWTGRAAVPLAIGMGAVQAANAAGDGDAEGVGSAVGGTAGSLGGAWAGAAGGAALGTMVFPGVGTAVGGAVGGVAGGIAGSAAGQWVGQKTGALWNWAFGDDEEADARADRLERIANQVSNPPDLLASPESVAETLNQTTNTTTDARTISPTFHVKVESTGDSVRDEALLDRLMQRLRGDLLPILGANDLDMRVDAALTDRGN
ncbi:phage tail tape measure protein [Halomonas getboli]|uniref:phage tail tape measure protein n=1 Tax=Halomonas getboli TaxID=2935862 RepID=UPI001FFE56BC|nr:phage tail tape measure protein [Halomonas getboli]MCK2185698.1 phage tail tape measure protein [Halomonas getboli]